MHATTLIALSSAPLLILAKTDLGGCTSSISGASVIYYVPGTGELCEFLDCGGGRAPPKTTVPGCPQYSGTATYSPNYLPGFGPNAVPLTSAAVVASSTASAIVITTSQPASLISSASSRSISGSSSVSTSAISSRSGSSVSSARLSSSQTATASTSRTSNSTVASPTATAFGGEAGHISAKIGLVGFLGAVVALL